jgi:hypothetical protein
MVDFQPTSFHRSGQPRKRLDMMSDAITSQTSKQKTHQPSKDSFRLPHYAVERAKHIDPPSRKGRVRKRKNHGFGIVAVNILGAIASYATDATMECWPAVPAIARDTGYSERLISYCLSQFEKIGIFNRKERYKQSNTYTWIRSDASGYTILNRKWWQQHAHLGEGRGLFIILHAVEDGRAFTMKVKKECLPMLGTSRTKFYNLLPALKLNGMVATDALKDATRFKIQVSQPAIEVSQPPQAGVPTTTVKGSQPQVSTQVQDKPDALPRLADFSPALPAVLFAAVWQAIYQHTGIARQLLDPRTQSCVTGFLRLGGGVERIGAEGFERALAGEIRDQLRVDASYTVRTSKQLRGLIGQVCKEIDYALTYADMGQPQAVYAHILAADCFECCRPAQDLQAA